MTAGRLEGLKEGKLFLIAKEVEEMLEIIPDVWMPVPLYTKINHKKGNARDSKGKIHKLNETELVIELC